MKPRIPLPIVVGLIMLIVGIILFDFSTRDPEGNQVFPAVINRDCAPWDGSAFTVSIPHEPGSIINISIWRAPEITLPVTLSFPDESLRIGTATFLLRFGYSVDLTGTVFFWRVRQGSPVEGRFELVTEAGQPLTGRFIAEWGTEVVYCG